MALRCRVGAGNPAPQVRWRKLNDRLPAGADSGVKNLIFFLYLFKTFFLREIFPDEEGATLHMGGVGRHHSGVYRCEASNGVGEPATAEISLNVLCEFKYKKTKLFNANYLEIIFMTIYTSTHASLISYAIFFEKSHYTSPYFPQYPKAPNSS